MAQISPPGSDSEKQKDIRELNCIFEIEEILKRQDITTREKYKKIVESLPASLAHSDIAAAQMIIYDDIFKTNNFKYTPWTLSFPIIVQSEEIGSITVVYLKDKFESKDNPFTSEEKQLINTVANRLEHFILYQDLKNIFSDLSAVNKQIKNKKRPSWKIILKMLRKTDPPLFMRLLRKILLILSSKEIEEANILINQSSISYFGEDEEPADENRPIKKKKINTYDDYIKEIIELAQKHIKDNELEKKLEEWLLLNKAVPLVKTLESESTSLTEISEAIRKYFHIAPEKVRLTESLMKGLRVSLLRRFFTDDLRFISVAKEYIKLTDFYHLIDKTIFMPSSHGKLGGKSSGLFIASSILRKKGESNALLGEIKTPKTWYMSSDGILYFMHYNDLEEMLEYKYKSIDEVRIEYPHIVQMFKNSKFPLELVHGFSQALDDFGDAPLVVRSSSLLEDQVGASFSGKYKSLFLANQGPKAQRLEELMDAITEVYASTFGPDPIEYRSEKGLLDFHEEMAVMIQEVVGTKIGNYYLPSFAGVAFSNNEFRWSPRIKLEDGLVRLVPGLGTRAVDRIGNDFPILAAPGQPTLRVNTTINEIRKYSPKFVDVINLNDNEFETISFETLVREFGDNYPGIEKIVSIVDNDMLQRPMPFRTDYEKDDFVVTFEGIFKEDKFLQKINEMLHTLQKSFNSPVDIEFASNGKDLFLLQCRPQSHSKQEHPDIIPHNVPLEKVLFKASKYVTNGTIKNVTHIVYVDPVKYSEATDKETLVKIGEIVGQLNKVLPRKKFILMGPGRWGSRGDIKLGVSVTYSDINNTTMLVEIAKKKGDYTPDLSFGTHFFQDLVEAKIRYLPLYPDEEDGFLNEKLIKSKKNLLPELLPEFAEFSEFIHVINLGDENIGESLIVLMNAEDEEGIGLIIDKDGIKSKYYRTKRNRISSSQINTPEILIDALVVGIKSSCHAAKKLYWTMKSENTISLGVVLTSENSGKDFEKWMQGWESAFNLVGGKKGGKTGFKIDLAVISEKSVDEVVKQMKEISDNVNEIILEEE
jgi:hypothetical protein